MKIAVLWPQLSGYLNACLRALAAKPGIELFVAHQLPHEEAPFRAEQFSWLANRYTFAQDPDPDELAAATAAFRPDAVLINSWHRPGFRRAGRALRGRALRVLCMDNRWRGTARQWLGVAVARWYLHAQFEAVFLPGEPQARFARKLGFRNDQIWRGLYTCDHASFAAAYKRRTGPAAPRRVFLFAGRLIPEKGIDILLAAYRRYRAEAADPWPLVVCGTGPLAPALAGEAGIRHLGFVQPDAFGEIMANAGCLVLPSRFEPWGLVIHEAAAAGLAVIASTACGAAVHLVQDGFNGYVVAPGDAGELTRNFHRIGRLNDDRLAAMQAASHALSLQYTPGRWADTVVERTRERLASLG